MDETRRKRYLQKLELIDIRVGNISSWTEGLLPEEFSSDDKTRLATFKALQEAIEACMDICAMLVKDLGFCTSDDYSNVEKLTSKGMFTPEVGDFLRRANGLRNRLIHEYNRISDDLVLKFVRSELGRFGEFSEAVSEWMRRK